MTAQPLTIFPDWQSHLNALLPQLEYLGLRDAIVTNEVQGGLTITCMITPEIEHTYQPKQDIGVALMQAVREAGGWVDNLVFVTHAE